MRCRRTEINQLLAFAFLAGVTLPAKADNPIAKELQNYGWHHFYGYGFGARHFGGGFHH